MTTTTDPVSPSPTRRLVRFGWLAVGSFFAATTLLFSGAWVASALARDAEDFSTTVEEPVERLVVDTDVAGSIEVVGTSGEGAVVAGTTNRGIVEPDHVEQLVDGTLTLRSDCDLPGPVSFALFCGVDYVVQVPADVDVEVRGHGGTTRVVGIEGSVELHVLGGGVELDDVSGPVEVHTQGGGVQGQALAAPTLVVDTAGGGADLTYVEAPSRASVTTAGGGITVVLPPGDEAYAIDGSASGGSEIVDVRTDPDAERVLKLRAAGGGITVRYGAGP